MSGAENPTNRTTGMEEEEEDDRCQDKMGLCWTGGCVNGPRRVNQPTDLGVVDDAGKGGSGRQGCRCPGGEERDDGRTDRRTDRRLCWGEALLLVADIFGYFLKTLSRQVSPGEVLPEWPRL